MELNFRSDIKTDSYQTVKYRTVSKIDIAMSESMLERNGMPGYLIVELLLIRNAAKS